MKNYKAGIIGGIVAGIVFGMMMQMKGMMPVIAKMMGGSSVAFGWLIHMMISIIFALMFVVLFGKKVVSWGSAIGYGIIEGVLTWIIGPLVVMPMMMGMSPFSNIDIMSLMTHIMFGLILSIVYFKVLHHTHADGQTCMMCK